MKKWRKIYLYIFAVILAGLEVFGGFVGYNDRGSFFEGVGVLILDIWLTPAVIGILYGVFEATDCFDEKGLPVFEFTKKGFKKLGLSTLRALGVSLFHGLLSPIIFVISLDNLSGYFEMAGVMLIWSLGVGVGVFLIVYVVAKLLFAAARELKKSHAILKSRKENQNAN